MLKNKEVNDYAKYLKSKLRTTLQNKEINVSSADDLTALISFVERLPSNSLRTLVVNNARSIQEIVDTVDVLETENTDLLLDNTKKDVRLETLENDLTDLTLEIAMMGGN